MNKNKNTRIDIHGFDEASGKELYDYLKKNYPDADINISESEAPHPGTDRQYRAVFENTGTATCIIEKDGTISLANQKFAQLSGYPIEEIEKRKKWMEFVVKDDLDRMWKQHELRRQKKGKAKNEYDFRFINSEGNIRFIHLVVDMIPGTDKSISSLIDVTDKRTAEQALKDSEEKFRSLVDQAAEMLFLHDMQGNIMDVNLAAIKNTGYTRKELENMNVLDIDPDAHDRNDKKKYWHSINPDDHPVTFEARHKTKSGEIYAAEITLSKVIILDKHYILALARNITERKKAEEEMNRLRESLQEQVEEKTRELKERIEELERFREATIDRELRMKELRDELEKYKRKQD